MRVAVVASVLLLAGCGTAQPEAKAPESKTVTVFAAASLTGVFGAYEKTFEAEHPGVDVKINFAGSSTLAQQINEGAAVDVFASADEANMQKIRGKLETDASAFATNKLVIVVPPGNPAHITGLADLAKDGVDLVVCAPQVPCGSAAKKAAGGVALKPKSEEQDVKAVLAKVTSGEADAGLVYVTDAKAAGDKVEAIPFPEADTAVNRYMLAVLKDAPEHELGKQFALLAAGVKGKPEREKAGFGTP